MSTDQKPEAGRWIVPANEPICLWMTEDYGLMAYNYIVFPSIYGKYGWASFLYDRHGKSI